MVVFVCGSSERLLGFEADAADVVELERFGGFDPAGIYCADFVKTAAAADAVLQHS